MSERQTVILFQGDSITDGGRNKIKEQDWDLNHQTGQGYVYHIQGELGARFPEKQLRFINKGISGNRIVDVYARLESDVLNAQPDIVSFLVGINDCHFQRENGSGATPEKFAMLYRLMIREVKERLPEAKLVLCEPFLLPAGHVADAVEEWKALLTPFQQITREVAGETGCLFIPLQHKFDELALIREPSYWLWDGIHPTVSGHWIIAQEWMKATNQIFS